MEIKQLKAFVAIAEANTFTAGAKTRECYSGGDLDADKAARGRGRAAALYAHAAAGHLDRGRRGSFDRARMILREHDAALAEIAELGGVERGRLRIGSASAEFTAQQLPNILRQLILKFPNADLSVSAGTSQTLVDKIMHGDVDIAFVSLPVENSSITTDRLFSDQIVAIAHPSSSARSKAAYYVEALASEKLILGERGGNTRRMIDEFFNSANVRPNVIMELSRQEAINQMVENNLGVGIAGAKTIADEIREGRLISWLIDGTEIRWELGLARLRGGYFSPIAKEFVRICKEIFVERDKELKAKKLSHAKSGK